MRNLVKLKKGVVIWGRNIHGELCEYLRVRNEVIKIRPVGCLKWFFVCDFEITKPIKNSIEKAETILSPNWKEYILWAVSEKYHCLTAILKNCDIALNNRSLYVTAKSEFSYKKLIQGRSKLSPLLETKTRKLIFQHGDQVNTY